MPLPSPEKNQKQNDFVSSCMSDETMRKEFPNSKQRAAVCYSQFSKKKDKSKKNDLFAFCRSCKQTITNDFRS